MKNSFKLKIDFKKALGFSFFQREPEIVAKELLGKILVKKSGQKTLASRIVETEAYLSDGDLSCHAAVGKTTRNAPMFEAGGILYVYKIYGVHHCINFVTGQKGKGSAVLIRAAEPLLGIEQMLENRGLLKKVEGRTEKGEGKKEKGERDRNVGVFNLCKGPGNLAKAFDFTKDDNFKSLISGDLFIQTALNSEYFNVSVSKRIGVTKSSDLLLRFYITNNPFVSGKK